MTDDDMRNEKLSMITNIKILLQLKKKDLYIYLPTGRSQETYYQRKPINVCLTVCLTVLSLL